MRSVLKGTTPFPNRLLDEVMPHLKDTEWRLLCVIVRQTLGWQDEQTHRRKQRDWLTRTQLKERTGRNSEALALAIDALINRGYITAHDSKGQSLATPLQRRNNHGRIYYGLSPEWSGALKIRSAKRQSVKRQSLESQHFNAPHAIIGEQSVIGDQNKKCSLLRREQAKSEHVDAGKPNTTKETSTKEKQTKGIDFLNPSKVIGAWNPPDSDEDDLIQRFITLFETVAHQHGHEKTNTVLSPSDAMRLQALFEKHATLDWTPFLHLFFESDLAYVIQRDYSLSTFLNTCNIFLCQSPPRRR